MNTRDPTLENMRDFVREALRRTARSDAARRREERGGKPVHEALGHNGPSLEQVSEHVAKENGCALGHQAIRNALWDVYFEAFHTGLITAAFHDGAWSYAFTFTDRGLDALLGEVPLWDSSHLSDYLREYRSRGARISDSQIVLLLEAQRCWRAGCHRAASVLVGLAAEEGAERVLESVEASIPQSGGSSLGKDWKILKTPREPLAKRWAAAVSILAALRMALQASLTKGSEPSWWEETWREPVESLHASINHIREQRNQAAHDPKRVFGPGEIAVLFPAVPVTIDKLARIDEFLRSPPGGVVLPAI